MSDLQEQVQDVFRGVFGDSSLVISRETTAKDVDGWDSMMHVTLLIAVEKRFHIRFAVAEMGNLTNVGELIDLVESKGGKP
jgi:acyl carrier protein